MRISKAVLIVLITLVALATSGCLNANLSMTISKNDRVTGQLLVAAPPDGQPIRFDPPEGLRSRVSSAEYTKDGHPGTRLVFRELTFRELEHLSEAISGSESRYHFSLTRSGSLVNINGEIDLTPLGETPSSLHIEITAPGEITKTNGRESAGVITWEPPAGEVTQISATYQYSGSQNQAWIGWAVLVGGVMLLAAVLVGLLAARTHLRARDQAPQQPSNVTERV